MSKILFILTGGALGALMRYLVSNLFYALMGSLLPWGTLAVNVIGSFLIGFLFEAFQLLLVAHHNLRTFVFIGFLGAFTTFSTYSLETLNLLRNTQYRLALSNILLNNILCLLFVILGFVLSKRIFS